MDGLSETAVPSDSDAAYSPWTPAGPIEAAGLSASSAARSPRKSSWSAASESDGEEPSAAVASTAARVMRDLLSMVRSL